jgi:hypothetical protein
MKDPFLGMVSIQRPPQENGESTDETATEPISEETTTNENQ